MDPDAAELIEQLKDLYREVFDSLDHAALRDFRRAEARVRASYLRRHLSIAAGRE